MKKLTICAAQIRINHQTLHGGIGKHTRVLKQAAEQGANLVLFPELSLSGYTLQPDAPSVLSPGSEHLREITACCAEQGVTAMIGAPLRDRGEMYIACLVITPNRAVHAYKKIFIHSSEKAAYFPGTDHHIFSVRDISIACAVCYDVDNHEHALQAKFLGADVYAAGVVCSMPGYSEMYTHMRERASHNSMIAVMANCVGETGGWVAAGGSAAWNTGGSEIIHAPHHEECLMFCEINGGNATGEIIPL